ncbi:MAG TPA: J domain-containing protein [Lacipirellula sp.]
MPDSVDSRPDFMVTLGLMPPYAIEDVKQAYRDKVKDAHPDRGGSIAAFNEIQQAFEQATAYLEFRGDRRSWIAAKMGRYAELQRAIERLERMGATVTTFAPAWLEQSFGDFAQLTETVKTVRLEGPADGDALIAALIADLPSFRELESLALPKCRVSDQSVLRLAPLQQLKQLDLSETPVTALVLDLIDQIESLETLNLEGTNVGWLAKRGARARLRRRIME